MTQTPYERFVSSLPAKVANEPSGPPWAVYERLKREFRQACPYASNDQYHAAIQAITKALNI